MPWLKAKMSTLRPACGYRRARSVEASGGRSSWPCPTGRLDQHADPGIVRVAPSEPGADERGTEMLAQQPL